MTDTAIITGASRGIGRACAIELAKHFNTIVINSHSHPDDLLYTKQLIEAQGSTCLTYIGDVGNYEFVHSMTEDILSKNLTINLLVNNAGISYIGLLTDMTSNDWHQIINTNLTSVFNCCHQVVPHMVSNKSGHIINISSMWGISGASCEVAYSTTKGGIHAFTKSLAKELAPSNIRVNALACGAIQTKMNDFLSEEEREKLCDDIPLGRLGTPEEIATMVWQLYSTPLYLTGEVIKIDGGYL